MRETKNLSKEEKEKIRAAVHREAEKIKWHTLSNYEKAKYYDKWSKQFNVKRVFFKDNVMKGFDVRQGIPLKGEQAIQKEIENFLSKSGVSLLSQFKVAGKYRVDLVFGFHKNFPTHVVEIERSDTWLKGFTQVLGYAADYFNEYQKLVQPVLVLFGNVSAEKLERIRSTCDFSRVALCSYNLSIKGIPKIKIMNILEYLGINQGTSNEES